MTLEAKAAILAILAIGLAVVFQAWPQPKTSINERVVRHFRVMLRVSLSSVALALIIVGVVSGTLRSHLVQIAPLVLLLVLPQRGQALIPVAAAAVFSWWLVTMAGIWLFLLGLSRFLTGRFSATEIVLTLVIGAASVIGLSASGRAGGIPLSKRLPTIVLAAGLQSLALWLSYQPIVAGR
jgi:hypothetical protein